MAIGEKVLDSVEVKADLLRDVNYLQSLQTALYEKHWLLIATYQEPPQFYIQVATGAKNPDA